MTAKELLDFCKEHDVELRTRHEFISDAYVLQMRKENRVIERTISRYEVLQTPGFETLFEKRLLKDMVNELDNLIKTK